VTARIAKKKILLDPMPPRWEPPPTEAPSPLSPALKWAGGKRWLTPTLLELYAPYRHSRLVEPFVGGLSVALALQPKKALLNDINPHLINFYNWLTKNFIIKTPLKNERDFYFEMRDIFNDLIIKKKATSKRSAELFYFLNRTGFNGLCRFNKSGGFNVPFGQYDTINYTTDFSEYTKVLKAWKFTCQDFESLPIRASDFIYADPPYDTEFTQYSKENFNWDDQVRLAEWLSVHQGPVVASNQATKRIVTLYKDLGFKIERLPAPRRISCNGDRTPAMEMLATKNII
jgi:DNA adenine methylase